MKGCCRFVSYECLGIIIDNLSDEEFTLGNSNKGENLWVSKEKKY